MHLLQSATDFQELMSADLINLGPMGRTLQADERLYWIKFVEKAPSRTFLPAED